MKTKVKNKDTGIVKTINSNVLNDYLSTKKWVKVEGAKEENKNKKSTFTINSQEEK